MRNQILSLLILLLTGLAFCPALIAAEPADKVIANALADIERYESQASSLTPGRSAGANRILKLMNLSHQRLAGSTNQTDPSWLEVNDRYLALQKQLEDLLNPPAAAASTSTSTPEASSSAQTPSPGSATPETSTAVEPSGQSAPPLVSGQRVRVKKLTRDLINSRTSIVTTGPSHFQDPDVIAARQKGLQQYSDAIARYPQLDDPDVQAARAEYEAFRQALTAEFERSKAQLEQLGDVQMALSQIDENSRTYPVPQALMLPFSAEDASQWVQAASSARTVAEHNIGQLEIIAPLAYLPNNPGTPEGGSPYDANDVTRLHNNATSSLSKIQSIYEAMANDLNNRMEGMNNDVLQRWQEDPDQDDKRWIFIAEGRKEEATAVFNENRALVHSAIHLEKALGRDTSAADAMLAKLDQAEAEFNRKAKVALEGSRLPEPQTSDRGMLKIAEQIMTKPKYGFGEHGEIILTTKEIVEREREDSEIEIDDVDVTLSGKLEMSGTQTTWTYKWQEFKFATPVKEADSDNWYIWWVTAKNFSSGGPKTPLNQWISGEANKGNPILPANL